jgi:hypothetical protein
LRPRLLVVCGGKRTEPDYLDALKRAYPAKATVVVRTRGDSPSHCIQYAIEQRRSTADVFDEVWCVLDVDRFDLTSAGNAAKLGVRLAVSNPCFEFWLLLHFESSARQFGRCKEVERELRRHLPKYNKAELSFDDFRECVTKACDRAKQLAEDEITFPNPSSGMWRLVELIMEGRNHS